MIIVELDVTIESFRSKNDNDDKYQFVSLVIVCTSV